MNGRRVVWSDDEIQKLTKNFVCCADEVFDLYPPKWFKWNWLQNPKSTKLFMTFAGNAPPGTFPRNTSTHQGIYCMTADGDFLSGTFAWAFKNKAKRILEQGLSRFDQIAKQRGYQPKPVPTDPIDYSLGKSYRRGDLRLEVAIRDLPRGNVTHPGRNDLECHSHNLNWLTLTAAEGRRLIPTGKEKHAVPTTLFDKMFLKTLVDNVRGQASEWKRAMVRKGQLQTELVSTHGSKMTIRLTGTAHFQHQSRAYQCQLHGMVVYDTKSRTFQQFDLVASGQRHGRDQFNGRKNDLGPAPMGVAFRMYVPKQ